MTETSVRGHCGRAPTQKSSRFMHSFMRQGLIGLAGTLALAGAVVSAGCGGGTTPGGSGAGGGGPTGGSTGTGGSTSTGGSGGSGGPSNCSNVTACGGDVVGTWNVASSCLKLSGDMDISTTSLGCPTVPVDGFLQTSGTFTANADGTYSDNTMTTGNVTFPLAPN